MPAIDPVRLKRHLSKVEANIGQPELVVKELDELFSFYADRTRRSSTVIQSLDTINQYGAPRPVVREAQQSLQAAVREFQLEPENLIQTLWKSGEREMRLVAVSLLVDLRWAETIEWARWMAERSRDQEVIKELAHNGLANWIDLLEEELLSLLGNWLDTDQAQLQQLSLLILLEHVNSGTSELLPSYFGLLSAVVERLQQPAQSTFRRVIRRLAQWNPPETAQFLLDEGRRHNWREPYRQLVQTMMADFPESQQREIRATLIAN